MKKSLRNLVIGAVVSASIFAISTTALAAGSQYVQTDMNFRNGPSTVSTIIGSVPAGAQVEVLDLQNGWNLIRYNGRTGYIHGGNLGDSYVVRKAAPAAAQNNQAVKPAAQTNQAAAQNKQAAQAQANATRQYFDNNWSGTAQNMQNSQAVKIVSVASGYLALRTIPSYDAANEIGQLYNGDTVQVIGAASGSYVQVFSPKYGAYGWVNAGFLR
ncbi:MAG: SH3 domain-containing protein [Lachnospiraceae bacterium]|nr:SH3 domain-containing protein [Lachnospiraceae bacterium]